jgi:hypothetical protein
MNQQNDLASLLAVYVPDNTLPVAEYAHSAYQKLLLAKKQQDVLFLIIGKLLIEIRDENLYKHLNYETFSDFLYSQELGFSGESAWMYMRVYEFYINKLELSPNFVASLPISRLSMMIPVLKDSNKDEAVDQLEELSELRQPDFLLRVRQNRSNKPRVYFANQIGKFIVEYYDDCTELTNLGSYEEYKKK